MAAHGGHPASASPVGWKDFSILAFGSPELEQMFMNSSSEWQTLWTLMTSIAVTFGWSHFIVSVLKNQDAAGDFTPLFWSIGALHHVRRPVVSHAG
jgi:hypothetical protein